jgi:hypothetical protein
MAANTLVEYKMVSRTAKSFKMAKASTLSSSAIFKQSNTIG